MCVGCVGFVAGRAGFPARAVHEIAGRDHVLDRSRDLSGRRVIFFSRCGESFRQRDPYVSGRADFFVPHLSFFCTRDLFFFPSGLSVGAREHHTRRYLDFGVSDLQNEQRCQSDERRRQRLRDRRLSTKQSPANFVGPRWSSAEEHDCNVCRGDKVPGGRRARLSG
jgi:hypothetical protein